MNTNTNIPPKKRAAKIVRWLSHKPIFLSSLLSILLTLVIECINRQSVGAGFVLIFEQPLTFILNAGVIFLSFATGLLFKRRLFTLFIVTCIWSGLGIVNGFLLAVRSSPLLATDFLLLRATFDIALVYYTPVHFIFISLIFISALLAGILMFKKSPKQKIPYLKAFAAATVVGVILIIGGPLELKASNIKDQDESNIAELYREHGFAYGFSQNLLNRGISMPEDYSSTKIQNVMSYLAEHNPPSVPPVLPNIIFLQLESFFDPNRLVGAQFSENPIPFFTQLSQQYSSGLLTVPTIGGGTVNTEFEVLTGLPLSIFAPGEYPYNSILRDQSIESLASQLRDLGYNSHAMHNHTGNFYDRNVVYKNLGFAGFTSLEYMQNVSFNDLNWARDESLLPEILSVLTRGTAPNLVFAVSVQAHGKYPEDWQPSEKDVAVIELPEKFSRPGFGYFINQLKDIDSFLSSLVTRLQALQEPIILVMYGDHLPGLGIADEDLINQNNHETDYVIWSNMELTPRKKSLHTYELSSELLSRVGIQTGGILGLHQIGLEAPQLFQDLRLLGYDRLYGQDFVASPEDPTLDSHFHMGQGRIRITQVRRDRDHIYISGKGFTTFSTILVNGKERETSVISPNLLAIENRNVTPQDELSVGQVSRMNAVLGTTQTVHLGYIPPAQSPGSR